jgi:hypothetical protein
VDEHAYTLVVEAPPGTPVGTGAAGEEAAGAFVELLGGGEVPVDPPAAAFQTAGPGIV